MGHVGATGAPGSTGGQGPTGDKVNARFKESKALRACKVNRVLLAQRDLQARKLAWKWSTASGSVHQWCCISKWDVSQGTNFASVFYSVTAFNQALESGTCRKEQALLPCSTLPRP